MWVGKKSGLVRQRFTLNISSGERTAIQSESITPTDAIKANFG